MVDNVVKDLSRSIERLDVHASADPGDIIDVGGVNWTGEDLRASVANSLAFITRRTVRLGKVTKRDVSLMMSAHGASTFTVEQHARAIAVMVRADVARHSLSAVI